jgi:type II secretory pathway component PulC
MRYYWEVLFSTEYFPYWEFTMLMMLAMLLSILWRLNRMETKLDDTNVTVNYLFTKEIEGE